MEHRTPFLINGDQLETRLERGGFAEPCTVPRYCLHMHRLTLLCRVSLQPPGRSSSPTLSDLLPHKHDTTHIMVQLTPAESEEIGELILGPHLGLSLGPFILG
jgi:hypothetical protein